MTRDIRICFIGDSLVNGTGDEAALGWAGRLCSLWPMRAIYLLPITTLVFGETRAKIFCCAGRVNAALRLPGFCDGRIVLSCGVNDTAIENGRVRVNSRGILRRTSERFCTEPSNTPCLWLVHRRSLTTNKMRESKAFRLRLLARQKRLAFHTSIFFLALCSDDAYKREVAEERRLLIQEVRVIPRWRVL